MRVLSVILVLAACCVSGTAGAQTEIHKCVDAEGGVVYSQLPCNYQKSVDAEAAEPAEVTAPESTEPELSDAPGLDNPQEEPKSEASRLACKKQYRDAIDEIDAEIRSNSSRENDGEYKQRLLALTRKLREC